MNFELSPYSVSTAREPWAFGPEKTHSHTVIVDSRDRDTSLYPNPNSYRVVLPSSFRNVSSARLVSAEIPGMFYVFTAARGNTTLDITAAGTRASVTIPDGNYTATTMASTLELALHAAFPGATFIVSLTTSTMRYTIQCTSHPSLSVTVHCAPGSAGVSDASFHWGLGYYLGFAKDTTSGTGSVSATGVLNVRPDSYILLRIRGLDNVYQSGMERRCFAKIPFTVSSFGINFFDKLLTDNILNPIRERLEWLDIELVWYDGTPVQFVGNGEHSFTIEMYCNSNTA